jgi:leucine proline-enriched proteoglycan (leprecan)
VWRLLTTLLAVAAMASRAEIESEAGWDLEAPDLLFAEGTAAYARGDWAGVVLSMERALRSRAALRALRLRCRTQCAADLPWEPDSGSPPSLAQTPGASALHDLSFFGALLRRAACLRRCLGPPAAHSLSEELELEFHKRSPYNYLQVAYFKVRTCSELGDRSLSGTVAVAGDLGSLVMGGSGRQVGKRPQRGKVAF